MASLPDSALGSFLRSRRERLDPAEVGLPPGSRRRTPGLRRAEVAQLADLSVEWYTRLEQGRGGTPSAQVLDSVADALLLTRAEREHLFLLAHGQRPEEAYVDAAGIGARFRRVLDGFPYGPAYLKNPVWDVVAWNRAARVLLSDYAAMPPVDRNVLKIMFLDPAARASLANWQQEARLVVSTFRLELTRSGAIDQAKGLVEELCARSADFARMWQAQDVGLLGEGIKQLRHPVAGDVTLRYTSFAVDDEPGLGLVLYTPDTDADMSRVRRLLDG